ncbi:MAG: ISL3 family transposase [Methyloglobulus sp.]|nr:ISL3 family transposase [Methyloglobulus sp.]
MLLNLPSITVTGFEEKDTHDYHVFAVPANEPEFCSKCVGTSLYGHGSKTQLVMDTPMHGRRVGILLARKRYKCRSCGITFIQGCNDINDRHRATNRLVKYVENKGLVMTFTSVAEEIGVTEGTVRNIVGDYIGRLEKKYTFETPEILGIDEVHLNRKMRLVFTNIGENTIVDLVGSRKKQVVIQALYRFKKLKTIKFVTMDMWRPYYDAVKAVIPDAVIVIDKFHVVKMANQAVEKGRKDIRGQMTNGEVKLLKKDRFLMLRRRRDLDATQEFLLSGWTENYPVLHDLYHAKERFYDIWDSNLTRKQAETAYMDWKDSIPASIRKYFADLDRAIGNWHKEVFNYFDHRVTNAYTESANNHIKSIARQGRGYSFEVLRAKTLFTNAKHKVKRKSFKSGVREDTIGYGLPNNEEFLNYGLIIPHGDEK